MLSSVVSIILLSVTEPPSYASEIKPDSKSIITKQLFSCNVITTFVFCELIATYSGSGSFEYKHASSTNVELVNSILRIVHVVGSCRASLDAISIIDIYPGGNCGGVPSPKSSSRSFSIATTI